MKSLMAIARHNPYLLTFLLRPKLSDAEYRVNITKMIESMIEIPSSS